MTQDVQDPELPLDRLHEQVHGDVLLPGDEAYDDARQVWNARTDRQPAGILQASGAADVIAGVNAARTGACPLSVKGGGHHVSGSAVCDDGLMIDLSRMNGVHVDPDAAAARVEAGATWGNIDHETQAFGLAVPGGQDPNIGVAGLTLGGGVGWLSPKYGLTCDNLLSADVVTADGQLVHASETENPDLFWALRGGGGNFGIVTSFEFQLHEVGPEIFAGSLIYPFEATQQVVRQYRDFMSDAPRDVRLLFGSMELPAASYYPESVHNTRVAMLIAFYAGPPKEGRELLAPLRDHDEIIMDSLRGRPYTNFQQAGDSKGSMRTYLRSQYVETLSDTVVETLIEYITDAPSSGATVFVSPWIGAETDPAIDATAYPHRDPAHHVLVEARWDDASRDTEHIDWVRDFHGALKPYTTGAVEMNFLTDDEPNDRLRSAYGDNHDRLVEVKTRWDPDNLFRMNQNIEPDPRR
ncbi:MAG: FAD-binding oxidoreductase [Halapricum sp.]